MKRVFILVLLIEAIFIVNMMVNAWAVEKKITENCPQIRNTKIAPQEYRKKINPLRNEPRHLKKGKVLFYIKAKPVACKHCHGMLGDGNGSMALSMNPKPRNFTCTETMSKLSDGQLFWVIKNGSKGTAMSAHKYLSEKKIWQLVLYIRSLAREIL